MLKRSLLALAALCFAASAAIASAGDYVVKAAAFAALRLYDFTISMARAVFAGPQPLATPVDAKPEVQQIAAESFALRLAGRRRPEIHPSWRMCPSC